MSNTHSFSSRIKLDKVVQLLLLVIFVTSCSSTENEASTGSITPDAGVTTTSTISPFVIEPTPTPYNNPSLSDPTSTNPRTATNTSTPFWIETLPPGQYLGYLSYPDSSLASDLRVLSMQGTDIGKIDSYFNVWWAYLSPNKMYVANFTGDSLEILQILNLSTNSRTSILTPGSCSGLGWSPDSLFIVYSCADIFVYSIEDDSYTNVTSRGTQLPDYGEVTWSPNGKWIVYHRYNYPNDPGGTMYDGIYLMDTSCLANVTSCQESTIYVQKTLRYFISPTWSPDSRYLAFLVPGKIMILDVEDQSFDSLDIPIREQQWELEEWVSLAWSPDGMMFALAQWSAERPGYMDINLVPVNGGETKLLAQKEGGNSVMFWFMVPQPFQVGDAYRITSEGANLNLRGEASLDSQILMKLQPGDEVLIVEGPASADGYEWWKIRTPDGVEGWVANIPEWYEPVDSVDIATSTITPAP